MAQTIQLKRGLGLNFAGVTLAAGEPAFLTDTGKLYIGDGTTNVLINPDQSTHSLTTDKLKTARTITVDGDVDGYVSFDGSQDVTITTTLDNTGVVAGTYPKVTVDAKGRVTGGSSLLAADIPVLTLTKITDAGTAAGYNVGNTAGTVPYLDGNGKLDTIILPGLALTSTSVVNSEVDMLALNVEPGDLAVRTDINKTFVLAVAPASTLANWQELLTPTDVVTSVNGQTGVIVLDASDVGLGNVTNESKATMLNDTVLTGTPTAPTAIAGTNTTQLATTGFVTDAVSTAVNGNVASATKLATARTIGITGAVTGTATSFDGTQNISINTTDVDASKLTGTASVNTTGNAATASKIATARTIALVGNVTGSVSFDGSANVEITATISAIDGGTF